MTSENRRSINQINRLIKSLVEQETTGYPFWIGGYVSRYYISDFGHAYFDLADENHTINCFLPSRVRQTLDFEITNGMDIEVYGAVQVYERMARVQIQAEQIRLISDNTFTLDQLVEQQLMEKGLWPPQHQPLPERINHIGIVTSKRSEALHDFENTYRAENGTATIKVADVQLVGTQAAYQIAQAIERFNHHHNVDIIVLTRGGGRSSELAVFNELTVAEAICRSRIPVMTGIGHQRDTTLADHAADVTAITPTAAAVQLARQSQRSSVESPTRNTSHWLLSGFILAAVVIIFLLISQGS